MRRSSNDLFKIFPDLPGGHRVRPAAEQIRRVRQEVELFRRRARIRIDEQHQAAARMRARARKGF
jgi:hypothetical protein